jgi:tripartite-type tricarboxylate transporter receptor subunit TctC
MMDFPSKPITWVVGFADDAADLVTRVVAASVAWQVGQPAVVENRLGANGLRAAEHVALAAPDGHTLFASEQGALVMNESAFAPVANIARAPLVLVAQPALQATDLVSFAQAARRAQARLRCASPGASLAHHVALQALKARVGLDIADVPYAGVMACLQAMLAGQAHAGVFTSRSVLGHIASGRLTPIACFSERRLPELPAVPALAELGLDGMDIAPSLGVVVPRRTAPHIIMKLSAEVRHAVHDTKVGASLRRLRLEPIGDTPERFAKFLQRQAQLWRRFLTARRESDFAALKG